MRRPLRKTSDCRSPLSAEAAPRLPAEDLFVYVYVLIHDLMIARAIAVPARPGPAPTCTDAELLAIAVARHLLGRRSEAGFLAEVARDWGHLFPVLPHQSEANRRTRWLWGAFEQFRVTLATRLPEDDCQQADTSALPVKHPSRVRGPDGWTGPGMQRTALPPTESYSGNRQRPIVNCPEQLERRRRQQKPAPERTSRIAAAHPSRAAPEKRRTPVFAIFTEASREPSSSSTPDYLAAHADWDAVSPGFEKFSVSISNQQAQRRSTTRSTAYPRNKFYSKTQNSFGNCANSSAAASQRNL